MDPETAEALDALCEHARPVILDHMRADSCIASTRVGMRVLRRLGVHSYPLACQVACWNEEGHELALQGREEAVHDDANDAWGVGIGYERPEHQTASGGYDGHLVLVVDQTILVDLSLDQASRPDRRMRYHPFWMPMEDKPVDGMRGAVDFRDMDGEGWALYTFRPGWKAWKQAPDWERDHQDVVDEVLARIEEGT